MRMRVDEMPLTIGRHRVGRGEPLFVIAEIGLNHGGSVDRAIAMVDAAAAAGASAVKLQTIVAAELVTAACPAPAHVQAESLRHFFAAFELDEAAYHAIAARTRAHGLALIATPLSEGAVDLLERVGVDAYKVASGDLTWTRLIGRCAHTGKPLILSTGMATIAEVAHGLAHAQLGGPSSVALLHCVSAYPVPHGSENLRAISTLLETFSMPVGLSDHGADTSAVPIAVVLGASLYERHLVLTAEDDAVDAAVSSTPAGLADLIRTAARVAEALGSGLKECLPAEAVNVQASRRGLYAARAMAAGHMITRSDVQALRPASALSPDLQDALVGSVLARNIGAGMPFLGSDLDGRADSPAEEKRLATVAQPPSQGFGEPRRSSPDQQASGGGGFSPAPAKDHRDVA
jgi:N,N'-diacetyllegionaminate synthase